MNSLLHFVSISQRKEIMRKKEIMIEKVFIL